MLKGINYMCCLLKPVALGSPVMLCLSSVTAQVIPYFDMYEANLGITGCTASPNAIQYVERLDYLVIIIIPSTVKYYLVTL